MFEGKGILYSMKKSDNDGVGLGKAKDLFMWIQKIKQLPQALFPFSGICFFCPAGFVGA